MQAVILAAGKGVRMRPLTSTKPKPLIKIYDKTILEYNLEALDGLVDEIIIIVGYRREMIEKVVAGRKNIHCLIQEDLTGTGTAVRLAQSLLRGPFIVMNGDDIYHREDIANCIEKCPAVLLSEVENPSLFGVMECDGERIVAMEEKPEQPRSNLVNTGLCCLPLEAIQPSLHLSERGEYELVEYLNIFLKNNDLRWAGTKKWFPVSYPWQMLEAMTSITIEKKINGEIEEGVVIKGSIHLEAGAVIKGGTRIEGPVWIGRNAVIGPNAYLRGPLSIGADCRIGSGVEIKNSIIGEKTMISHLSYVGDSIIGSNSQISAGVIVSNTRLDKQSIRVRIKEEMVDTGRQKLGAIIGDQVSIGVNSSIMPGTNIEAGSVIAPNTVVKGNYGY